MSSTLSTSSIPPPRSVSCGFSARARRSVAAGLLTLMGFAGVGCYGKFPLTHAVYNLNGSVTDSKLVHSLLYWVFIIIPVYWVAILVDAIIFNLIEFWTGETLVVQSTVQDDGTRITLAPGEHPDEALLTVERPDGTTTRATFVRVSAERMDVRDGDGILISQLRRSPNGDMLLCDANGEVLRILRVAEMSDTSALSGALQPKTAAL